MDKEHEKQSKAVDDHGIGSSSSSSTTPVAPEMQNVEENNDGDDDQIQNTTTPDDVFTVEPEAGGSSEPATAFVFPTQWPKDVRGRGKIGGQAAAETLVLINTAYDAALCSPLNIQEVPLRIQEVEEPSSKKPRLMEPHHHRTYACWACNTSFSTIEALNAHVQADHEPPSTTASDGDDGDQPPTV